MMQRRLKNPPIEWVCSYNRAMLDDGYSLLEASIYGFIWFKTQEDRLFFCSNEYLSKFFNVHRNSIQKAIDKLVKTGIIGRRTVLEGNKKNRYLWVLDEDLYNPKLGVY